MVLNSQSPRTDSPGRGRYHAAYHRPGRRRRNRTGLLLLVLVCVGALAAYRFLWNVPEAASEPYAAELEAASAEETAPVASVPVQPVPAPSPAGPGAAIGRGAPSPSPSPAPPSQPAPAPQPTATTEPPPRPAPTALPAGDPQVAQGLSAAEQLVAAGKLVQARDQLNRMHAGRRMNPSDAARVRTAIAQINQTLIFSPAVAEGDPHARTHSVEPGEFLSSIAPAYQVPWQFIARINSLDPNRVPAGARIKVVRGPFHVVVDKGDYRMDLYLGDPTQPGSMYVRSFEVGLGAGDSTPIGRFIVRRGKLENPDWRNPRNTSEYYAANDPKNPIGERWIPLRGLDAASSQLTGYGIHGTVDAQSIGRQASMGCVRMRDDDVRLVFDMLTEEKSTVTIQE
jgi:lipoprotein-anchoring transpeptidase ErfK/SrfK